MAYCSNCGQMLATNARFCGACGTGVAGTSVTVELQPAASTPLAEKTFLQENGVTVTDARFIVPGQTYAVSGITSVRFDEIKPKLSIPGLVILLGIIVMLLPDARIYGVLCIVGGVAWCWMAKSTYAVTLSSASGEVRAISSEQPDFISGIVDALNQAIVYRR